MDLNGDSNHETTVTLEETQVASRVRQVIPTTLPEPLGVKRGPPSGREANERASRLAKFHFFETLNDGPDWDYGDLFGNGQTLLKRSVRPGT